MRSAERQLIPLDSEHPLGLGRKHLHWMELGFPSPILLSWQMLGGWPSQSSRSQPPPHLAWAAGTPLSFLGEQNGDERQLSEPQKEAHFTGAQIVCSCGILGCQLDTEGWPGPCSLYLGGGCRPRQRTALSHQIYLPQSLGSAAFTSEDRLVLGGRVVTLPSLIGFSMCAASWNLSDWDVPRVDFSKASCRLCSCFLVVMITGSIVLSCWKWQTGAWGTRDSDERGGISWGC